MTINGEVYIDHEQRTVSLVVDGSTTIQLDVPALVQRAVKDLQLIRRLVSQLPRLPVGDHQELVRNLDAASESLRTLYFLDTIY